MSAPILNRRPEPVVALPAGLFEAAGPVVSVYLNTNGALPDGAEQVALRWKNLRRCLSDQGAPDGALAAVEPLLGLAHAEGETLVVIANAGGLLYGAHLPELPDDDVATVGPLPHLVPFLAATQRMLAHLVVVTDRVGAEIIAVLPTAPDQHWEVTGDDQHITRSGPGGWSQRRFQQRAENRWEANARDVADELTRLVDTMDPRLVVVSGDVRAVSFLREHLPVRVTSLLSEVQGDYGTLDEALRRSQQLIADLAEDDTTALLADYQRQQGQTGHSPAGPAATLDALARGQIATVLLDPEQTVGHTAWFGPDLAQVAADPETLQRAGVADPTSAPLVDVVTRAAAGTGAAVRIAPAAPPLAPTGVGGLVRY